MSRFDPALFKQQTFNAVADTKAVPIPADEYTGVITKSDITTWQANDDPSKAGLKWLGQIELNDADGGIKAVTGRDKNSIRYEFILDLTEDGNLDLSKGMNLRLGRLQVALGIQPGKPWSFDDFLGREVKVFVKHSINAKTGDPVANVDAVAAA